MDDVCSCDDDAVLRGLSLVYLARKLNVCHVSGMSLLGIMNISA
jgi:hypothetical protein